jgi:hypothetical protein
MSRRRGAIQRVGDPPPIGLRRLHRINASRAQFILDQRDARPHDTWGYGTSYRHESVRKKLVNRCCHGSSRYTNWLTPVLSILS